MILLIRISEGRLVTVVIMIYIICGFFEKIYFLLRSMIINVYTEYSYILIFSDFGRVLVIF